MKLRVEFEMEKTRLVLANVSVTCLHTALKASFWGIPVQADAQSLIAQLDEAVAGLSGMLVAATRTPAAANNDVDVAALDLVETSQPERHTRALFWLLGDEVGDLSDQEREAKEQKFGAVVVEKRDLQRALASHPHGLLRVQLGECNGCGPRAGAAFTTSSGGAAGHTVAEPGGWS